MLGPSDLRITRIPLNQGAGHMPALGFGTLISDPAVTITATRDALEAGFRHFDCAERYRNEREVGRALQEGIEAGGLARGDIFVTTKLWNTNHRPERVEPAFQASLDRLRLKYLDLYLIHTPFAFQPGDDQDPRDQNGNVLYDRDVTLLDTWKAMETLVDLGKCRAIGLSDITLDKLKPIYEFANFFSKAGTEGSTFVVISLWGKFGGPCAWGGTFWHILTLPSFGSKSFAFKNVVAKEGLPKDVPVALGAGGPRFKSGRPDQNISRKF